MEVVITPVLWMLTQLDFLNLLFQMPYMHDLQTFSILHTTPKREHHFTYKCDALDIMSSQRICSHFIFVHELLRSAANNELG